MYGLFLSVIKEDERDFVKLIKAFLEGKDFEDVIRTAVSLGGDCDTLTCIAGSMAEAFYGVPEDIYQEGYNRLDPEMKDVLNKFYYMISRE